MTFAQLKRDLANKAIKLELVERYGKTGDDIPERCRGIRNVVRSNTVGATLITDGGIESEMRLDSAFLTEYTGDFLVIYDIGKRELTEEERKVFNDYWKYLNEYVEKNPYASSYWAGVKYCKDNNCEWVGGNEYSDGKKYISWEDKMWDKKVRGDAILKYKVYHN